MYYNSNNAPRRKIEYNTNDSLFHVQPKNMNSKEESNSSMIINKLSIKNKHSSNLFSFHDRESNDEQYNNFDIENSFQKQLTGKN